MQNLGYNKPLYILAFDHRSSFTKKILGVEGEPNKAQIETIKELKEVIFQGFKQGIEKGISKEAGAILCDEQFGEDVLKQARADNHIFAMCTEKSGQPEFMFEYDEQFGKHIQDFAPTFVKALVRYNPEDEDQEMNKRQTARLKQLSDYCHENGFKFLLEPLIPATPAQLEKTGNDQKRYDLEIRPKLMVNMVKEFHDSGVEPDVWKIEGLEQAKEYQAIVNEINADGRGDVSAVILGRGADANQVEKWLKAGAKVPGMIGFAIGRTIFHQPLMDYMEKKLNKEQTIEQISNNYLRFYKVFTSAKSG